MVSGTARIQHWCVSHFSLVLLHSGISILRDLVAIGVRMLWIKHWNTVSKSLLLTTLRPYISLNRSFIPSKTQFYRTVFKDWLHSYLICACNLSYNYVFQKPQLASFSSFSISFSEPRNIAFTSAVILTKIQQKQKA